jgi:UDP-N-acetylmuramoylalanine--D-glutamate ligase
MTLAELEQKSLLILGFGTEGQATYEFIRNRWPSKPVSIADRRPIDEFPEHIAKQLLSDPEARLNLGPRYLDSADGYNCDVIIKTPGIPASTEAIARARKAGRTLTSHSQIFLSNYPREKVIGVTGTKGKSTTSSLIHHILKSAGLKTELVGNIGKPPLSLMDSASRDTIFVHEFSSHQLAEIETSPHIAVLLNIVPEHLDYYANFDEYVEAKEHIARFQSEHDFLVFSSDYPIPNVIAGRANAKLIPCSTQHRMSTGCFVQSDAVVWSQEDAEQDVMPLSEISLPGRFNIQNVMPAVAAAMLCAVQPAVIRDAVGTFKGLPHRLEPVGTYNGITFYDDSIATVPDATLAALDALGPRVQTLILGGHERNLDFTDFGRNLAANVKTVILFPPSGIRIWTAIETHSRNPALPAAFFVRDMEQAIKIAYERTAEGNICLLSPASPSFGTFKDYKERGELFKAFVRKLSNS